ncbi:MAG: methylated-DNA--[protein]-cysteine S-methyltransferase [Candidatus Zixiibacteriota bacterium]
MIVFRDFDSPLGPMIGGATENGVCFLEFHDRGGVERIHARVTKRYKQELSEGTNRHLDLLEKEISSYFAGTLELFSVVQEVTGTAFEMEAWQQLLKIPYGKTCSYGEQAKAIGRPGAARAVGRANGANYLSIIIPCHRVIEAGGGLRGYGGGLWRKRALLDLEAGRTTLPLG